MDNTGLRQFRDCLPNGVHLLAVSKGHSASAIRELARLGYEDFGESRLQEALPKLAKLEDLKGLRWHFVGHLQSNKVRNVVKFFSFIHSVDSLVLAQRISRIAGEEQKVPKLMLQVKLRKDDSKTGFAREHLFEAWPHLNTLPNVQFIGLMTIAPKNLALEGRKTLFSECRGLADQLHLHECSMGMSSDWREAVEAGATWLRLGSALFGARLKDVDGHTDITKHD